ncbi:MAG TPA: YkgJ family cysteine cluster protein [Candidatus Limnocylindria bacterium]|nr:YkgJ family cysteine cluster protein [Candidatus Limnocylindria bacterium]
MSDERGWFRLSDARPLYRAAGADVRVVGWAAQPDGRQPMLECTAFDAEHLQCGVYTTRPEHCRIYDCRDDDEYAEEEDARPHCDIARHRRMEALRARRRA